MSQHRLAPILYFLNLFYILLQEIKLELSSLTCARVAVGRGREEGDTELREIIILVCQRFTVTLL